MPDAESQLSRRDEALEPEVVGVVRFELSGLALGPDYPANAISAELGRVAIAAARVEQEYALLLSGLHAGDRADWDFKDLRRRSSAWLCDKSVDRVKELFEGQLLDHAHAVVQSARRLRRRFGGLEQRAPTHGSARPGLRRRTARHPPRTRAGEGAPDRAALPPSQCPLRREASWRPSGRSPLGSQAEDQGATGSR